MKKGVIGIAVVIPVALCLGALLLESQTRIIRRAIDDVVFDNWNHYLPCDKLPEVSRVREVVEEHQETIRRVEAVNPGLVGVEISTGPCPGKADLLIWYASHQNRVDIEEIIGGERFFGVPYRLQNR
jgi:hypothetical protein